MDNDFFKQLAERALEKNKEEEKSRGSGGFTFEPVNWTAFEEKGQSKVIRFCHDLIASKKDDFEIVDKDGNKIFNEFSPRTVNVCTIYGDDHKKFFAYVPDKDEDPGYIFWRMMDIVLKREWITDPEKPESKKAIYVHEKSHPELVDRFLMNGFHHNVSKNKFDRGWKPQKSIIANVIDRSILDKHRELKHAFLLSKNVNYYEGNSFFDTGVPSYGFLDQTLDIVSIYGGLTSYDLLVERTGEKSNPWKIRNASRYIEEVPKNLRELVSSKESLTEEELSWEQYNLDKMYKPTSYRKWFSKIKVLAKQIDLTFNTHFHDELEEKAEKEKKEVEERRKEEEEKGIVQGTDTAPPPKREKREETVTEPIEEKKEEPQRRRGSEKKELPITWETLEAFGYKGKEYFNDEVASKIDRITPDGDVVWKEDVGSLLACFEGCNYKGDKSRGFESPDNSDLIKGCIWCSDKY